MPASAQDRRILFRDFYVGQPRAEIASRSGIRIDGDKIIINENFLGRRAELEFSFDGGDNGNLKSISIRVDAITNIPADGRAGRAPSIEYGWLQAVKGYFTERGFDICTIESRGGRFDPLSDRSTPGEMWGKVDAIENSGVTYALSPFAARQMMDAQDRQRGIEPTDMLVHLIQHETLISFGNRNSQSCGDENPVDSESAMTVSIFMNRGYVERGMPAYFSIFIGKE